VNSFHSRRHPRPWLDTRRPASATSRDSTSSCLLRPLRAIDTPLIYQECCDKPWNPRGATGSVFTRRRHLVFEPGQASGGSGRAGRGGGHPTGQARCPPPAEHHHVGGKPLPRTRWRCQRRAATRAGRLRRRSVEAAGRIGLVLVEASLSGRAHRIPAVSSTDAAHSAHGRSTPAYDTNRSTRPLLSPGRVIRAPATRAQADRHPPYAPTPAEQARDARLTHA